MGDSATRVLLVAAGGLAREVLSLMRSAGGWDVVGMIDEDPGLHGRYLDGVQVIGPAEALRRYPDCRLLVCHESPAIRQQLVDRLAECGAGSERYATFIGLRAPLAAGVRVGAGTLVLAESVVAAGVTLGEHVVVMPRVSLAHDVVVSAFATVGAGAALAGQVEVGRGAWLEMRCSVASGVAIGRGATVGMGSAVLDDVPHEECWAGVPARPIAGSADRRAPRELSYGGGPQDATSGRSAQGSVRRSAFERLAAAAALQRAL